MDVRLACCEPGFDLAVASWIAALRIVPDHIDIARWRTGRQSVQSIPDGIAHEARRYPTIDEAEIGHEPVQVPAQRVGLEQRRDIGRLVQSADAPVVPENSVAVLPPTQSGAPSSCSMRIRPARPSRMPWVTV